MVFCLNYYTCVSSSPSPKIYLGFSVPESPNICILISDCLSALSFLWSSYLWCISICHDPWIKCLPWEESRPSSEPIVLFPLQMTRLFTVSCRNPSDLNVFVVHPQIVISVLNPLLWPHGGLWGSSESIPSLLLLPPWRFWLELGLFSWGFGISHPQLGWEEVTAHGCDGRAPICLHPQP